MLHAVKHHRVTPGIKFADTPLYTWVERGTVTVKCPRTQSNDLSQGSNPDLSFQSQSTDH